MQEERRPKHRPEQERSDAKRAAGEQDQGMDRTHQYRLRIQNCVGTIMDLHSIISAKFEDQAYLSQVEGLEEAVESIDVSLMSEGDILMVEQATNALLDEFRSLFEAGIFKPVYRHELN